MWLVLFIHLLTHLYTLLIAAFTYFIIYIIGLFIELI